MIFILPKIDPDLLIHVLKYEPVFDFIVQNGKDDELVDLIKKLKHDYFN